MIEHNRDLNAAINLESYPVGFTGNACGESSSGVISMNDVKLGSVKQELILMREHVAL
jgi:transposase